MAAVHVWESQFLYFRRFWRTSMIAAVVQPLIYLVGMGLGIGALVDRGTGSTEVLGGVPYLAFVAPALIAASAMNVAASDSLWPLLDGFKWSNAYRAMIATPLTPRHVVAGITLWHATKALITSTGVAIVLLLFADTRTLGLLLAVPFGVATGLAFALPISAWSSTRERDGSFPAILRFGIIPMFLFGGIFYPISQLPALVRPLAQITPIHHGVELTRGAVLGTLTPLAALTNIGVLLAYAAVGYVVSIVTFTRRLTP